jgi:hypothetical protein
MGNTIDALRRIFNPSSRNTNSGFVTKKETVKVVTKWLTDNEWIFMPRNDLTPISSILAKKGPSIISVQCTGTDNRLLVTSIGDLREAVLPKAYHPVFIYGEEKDPRLWSYIRPGNDIVLPLSEIDRLSAEIDSLSPTMISLIDAIELPNILHGWVKISPHGLAALHAHFHEEVVGSCQTTKKGTRSDGSFRFKMYLDVELPYSKIIEHVLVRISVNDKSAGIVKYLDKITIIPAKQSAPTAP